MSRARNLGQLLSAAVKTAYQEMIAAQELGE